MTYRKQIINDDKGDGHDLVVAAAGDEDLNKLKINVTRENVSINYDAAQAYLNKFLQSLDPSQPRPDGYRARHLCNPTAFAKINEVNK